MKDFENMSKEELIKIIDHKANENLNKKASLKEILTSNTIKNEDTLFITAAGYILGKPCIDGSPCTVPYIVISDVVMVTLNSSTRILQTGLTFQLAIDQIIAYTPVDRDSFLSQLKSL